MNPLYLLGALAVAWAFKPKNAPKPRTTADALIDPGEVMAPQAPLVRSIILQTMQTNSLAAYENTAVLAQTSNMPKTAANIRAYRDMLKSGGHAVAGDEIGAEPRLSAREKRQIPDWLRFQATQSKLSGDPRFIAATAETMRRYGYRRAAEIHLKAADGMLGG